MLHAGIAYASGPLPRDGDHAHVVGQVGRDVTVADGKAGARLAFIRALAAVNAALGSLDMVERVLTLTVYVHGATDFTQQSAVADGASDLLFELFGTDRGGHARTSVGMAQLPRNGAVEVDALFALRRHPTIA